MFNDVVEEGCLAAVGAQDPFENSSSDSKGFFRDGEAKLFLASRVDVADLEAL